ncbi:uncharacterized protein LOC126625570 [Malus sylvestris]|uniref:uncharacterized protein LOC126625570 n=1 Tax=Malus sylvestris TaxID=3752 RepID=UPI0021ACEFDD|nr:uncharacterized protein LOC126625570 [Malus sylvestris]
MEHFEDENADEPHFEGEEVEGTTQRERGPLIPNWKEQVCCFDASGKCISEISSAFSKHVVAEVRDFRHMPLVSDWRQIKQDLREAFWIRIKETIIFLEEDMAKMPMIRHITLHIAEHAYKEYRNKLKKNIILEIAAKNKYNLQLKTMNHTTGAKSFARVRA